MYQFGCNEKFYALQISIRFNIEAKVFFSPVTASANRFRFSAPKCNRNLYDVHLYKFESLCKYLIQFYEGVKAVL